jgi:cysteine-rich repeat protein
VKVGDKIKVRVLEVDLVRKRIVPLREVRGLADVTVGGDVFVNVITHLEERRVRSLVLAGAAFEVAVSQAEGELQAALGVGSPGVWAGATGVSMSMLGGDSDPNAYLLAVSAVLVQAAAEAAGPGGPVDGELQELLNTVAQDLGDDGAVSSELTARVAVAQLALDSAAVKVNLAARFSELGIATPVPDLDRVLDQDLDGLVNADDNCPRAPNPDQADWNLDGLGDACSPAFCGNGLPEGREACDDGNADDDDACTSSCTLATCGDGLTQAGVEACDDGNGDEGDACLSTCELASCGDGFVFGAVEACDDGNAADDDDCLSTCELASCGDGFVHVGVEACDDGNGDESDSCLSTCESASCGDGFVQAGVEACDDGNDDVGDNCPACAFAACGDGFLLDGFEECDDGDLVEGNGCDADCTHTCFSGSGGAMLAKVDLTTGHCYGAFEPRHFFTALNSCQSRGAYLVSISSAAENDLVRSFFPGENLWIGLWRPSSSFTWASGEPVTFTNWAPGQPDFVNENPAMMITDGTWHDVGATFDRVFICETAP